MAVAVGPMCGWPGLPAPQPALGIWRLPWGHKVFPGLDLSFF